MNFISGYKMNIEKEIEKAIRETLVIQNKDSVHYAIKKIITILEKSNTLNNL